MVLQLGLGNDTAPKGPGKRVSGIGSGASSQENSTAIADEHLAVLVIGSLAGVRTVLKSDARDRVVV